MEYFVPRFWAPLGKAPLLEGAGFLVDPEERWLRISLNETVKSTADLTESPCLVLLGEPGTGKTTAVHQLRELITVAHPDHRVRTIDLGAYGDEARLLNAVLDDDASGPKAAQPTILLLDSLDECRADIPHIGRALAERIADIPADRLRLVVACRSADWPDSLEQALSAHYGAGFGAYELQPLRRRDVAELAEAAGAQAGQFLDAVAASGVGALATRPLSLKLLLAAFDRGSGALPGGQQALYDRAMQRLADEWNPQRREAGRAGALSVGQRISVAESIAAAMLFSGSSTLWTGPAADAPDVDLALDVFLDAQEHRGGAPELRRETVLETLDSALFTGRGTSRVGWAHQTFMEYLAARHLVRTADAARSRLLLCDGAGAVVPHLRPVAAWLVRLRPELLAEAVRSDPRSFIGLGVDLGHEQLKAEVVDGLLAHASAGRFAWDRPSYAHLDHDGLEAQLRPVLEDRSQPDAVRTVALDISEDNRCRALQDTWASIALDQEASLRLRSNAGHAVVRLADEPTKHQLLPLALGQAGDDPDDELKGMGLSACWPGALTLAELLPLLTAPKENSLYGAYKSFLISDLPQHIADSDVADLLRWLSALPYERGDEDDYHAFGPFRGAVVSRALALLDDAEVAAGIVGLALRMGRLHRSDDDWPADALASLHKDQRKRLLSAVLHKVDDRRDLLALTKTSLFSAGDFPLVFAECAAREPDIPSLLGELATWLFVPERREHAELVLALDRESALYREHFARWCEPQSLDSEIARMRARARARAQPTADTWTADELHAHLAGLLARADDAELEQWWRFCLYLCARPGDLHGASEFGDDLTSLPGWELLSHEEQALAAKVAERYLTSYRLDGDAFATTNTWHRPAAAGFQAAALLLRREPARLANLDATTWREWAAVCLTYPVAHGAGDREVRDELLRQAYRHAPEAILNAIRARIGSEAERDHFSLHDALGVVWDERVAQALHETALDKPLAPTLWSGIIDCLVERQYAPAVTHALAVFRDGTSEDSLRIEAGLALLAHLDMSLWPDVWAVLDQEPALGRDLFLRAGDHRVRLRQLDEDALRSLYVWLMDRFPPEEDPDIKGAHPASARESVTHVRSAAISRLIERGTDAAVHALDLLAEQFPERPWMRVHALQAEEVRKRSTWVPIPPGVLFRLLDNPESRLVRSAGELRTFAFETLLAVAAEARQNSDTTLLWNGSRPRHEEEVSLYLRNRVSERFARRGGVANREVEVRPSPTGKGIGQRTDLHITAAATQGANALTTATVVVEVKGIWHREVAEAMRTQLWERYLKPNGLSHGLYVVLVPDLARWDVADPNRRVAEKRLEEGLEDQLKLVAGQLRSEGAHIQLLLFEY